LSALNLYEPGEPIATDDLSKIKHFPTSGDTATPVISFGVSEVTDLAAKVTLTNGVNELLYLVLVILSRGTACFVRKTFIW